MGRIISYLIITTSLLVATAHGIPIIVNTAHDSTSSDQEDLLNTTMPTFATAHFQFLQQYGYVPEGDNTSDYSFSEHSLAPAIKTMQRFGNLPQTGVIDEATIKLMKSPRCGVKDVENPVIGNRRKKRYILASKGWNKRSLTYSVDNWSPQLWNKSNVQRELKKAFTAWEGYSKLRFTEVENQEADINIYFAQYTHSDRYPFDGPGGILAHAYYPFGYKGLNGDIHFDDSETWAIRPKDEYSGLDFFAVAVHEIGHSLGLAHSDQWESIMFPYYKGYEPNFALGYDDVMAMYELYIRRFIPGDGSDTSSTTGAPDTEVTHEDDESTKQEDEENQDDKTDSGDDDGETGEDNNTDDTNRLPDIGKDGNKTESETSEDGTVEVNYEGDSTTVDEHLRKVNATPNLPSFPTDPLPQDDPSGDTWEEEQKRISDERNRLEAERRRRDEEHRKKHYPDEEEQRKETKTSTEGPFVPDICKGSLSAGALLRRELFFFKGEYLWRYKKQGHLEYGYPAPIQNLFYALPSAIKEVNAVYQRNNDSRIVFFVGKHFYVTDGNELFEGSPRPISDYGLPDSITEVDAVFTWAKNHKTYIFQGYQYWRFNETAGIMDEGYPRHMQNWNGIPGHIDAVLTDDEGYTHFFKGNQFWLFDNDRTRPAAGYPESIRHWVGC